MTSDIGSTNQKNIYILLIIHSNFEINKTL